MNRPLATVLLLGLAHIAVGQCANNNTLTGAAVTPTCSGTITVPCLQGGQYVLVNVVAGNVYTFSTCGALWMTKASSSIL